MDGSTRNRRGGRATRRTPLSPGAGLRTLEPRLLLSADVLTYHNDNARDGANLKETVLTPSDVNVTQFGKLGQVALDGQVYAQPLVKTGVYVPGQGVHDVVYVATEHDSVYALDANTLQTLWHVSFVNPAAGITTQPIDPSIGLGPEVGITSTPVIDPTTGTLYVVGAVALPAPGGARVVVQQLHALDLGTGREKFGGPVVLQASVPGTGDGNPNGQDSYDAAIQNQRPALLLSNGVVYIASASFGDDGPYHGWMLGYNARTLQLVSAFNDTPDGAMGGIWMSGGGPAADAAGNLYLGTGNGTTLTAGAPGNEYGSSVVKLAPNGTTVTDVFTPWDYQYLNDMDLDFGSGGVVLLPDQPGPAPHLAVTAGKNGTLYLLNRDNLGGHSAATDNVVQEIRGPLPGAFDTPAYFNGTIYYVGTQEPSDPSHVVNAPLQAYSLTNGQVTRLTSSPQGYGYPGATPSVSANGAKNGIVWTVAGSDLGSPAVLIANDASNVGRVLYASNQAGARDTGGTYNKFTPPTVANGKVYVAGKGSLTLYGLLPAPSRTSSSRPVVATRRF